MVSCLERECWKCNGTRQKLNRLKQLVSCNVCAGSGSITTAIPEAKKPYRPFKLPINKGPPSKYGFYDPLMKPRLNEILCGLSGKWCIYQHEHGHRVTTDDYCCAAIAVQEMKSKSITAHLDLGTGLGSVLNLVRWAFNDLQQSTGVEAQVKNAELAKKTIEFNFGSLNADIINCDLRELDFMKLGKFDLVTGTPPYFRNHSGSLPVEDGRHMCAFEFRGGIQDYCFLASKLLRDRDSRFVVANTSLEISRTETCGRDHGLELVRRVDFHGKEGKRSLFSIFVFRLCLRNDSNTQDTHQEPRLDSPALQPEIESINIRDCNGEYTQDYINLTVPIGLPETRS